MSGKKVINYINFIRTNGNCQLTTIAGGWCLEVAIYMKAEQEKLRELMEESMMGSMHICSTQQSSFIVHIWYRYTIP